MIDADVQLLSSSEALLRLGLQRDPDAWSALIDRHGAAILRTAGRVTNDADLREDICQETLLQIRAHARDFRPQGNSHDAELFARAWIMRIACCTALKMIRTRTRSVERENKVPPAAPPTSPAETVVAREQAEQIRREVAALPEAHRDAVSLRYFGECAYGEIAAILRISEEAAKKRVQRGLDQLRERLAACGIALSATLLASVLQQSSTFAAEATAVGTAATAAGATSELGATGTTGAVEVLDLSRRAAWQALVNSSQTPALTGVVLGGLTMGAKTGIGIAAAALLALGIGGGMEIRASRHVAEQAAASAAETAQQARALETKLEGSRNEIDALRRVVESRNSELTSLRDKVAELSKRSTGSGGGFAGIGMPGLGDQVFVHKIDENGVKVRGADGKDIPLPDIELLADGLKWQKTANGRREVTFPGGKMVIQMQADGDVNRANLPDQVPPQGPDVPNTQTNTPNGLNAPPNVLKNAPTGPNAMPSRPLRVQLPQAVVPPAPPNTVPLPPPPNNAPGPKGKAEGEF